MFNSIHTPSKTLKIRIDQLRPQCYTFLLKVSGACAPRIRRFPTGRIKSCFHQSKNKDANTVANMVSPWKYKDWFILLHNHYAILICCTPKEANSCYHNQTLSNDTRQWSVNLQNLILFTKCTCQLEAFLSHPSHCSLASAPPIHSYLCTEKTCPRCS